MHLVIYFRYITIYREVINSKSFEWCEAMDNKNSNPISKFMLALVGDAIPHLFHPCPYEKVGIFVNVLRDLRNSISGSDRFAKHHF